MPTNTERALWADHARKAYLKAKREKQDGPTPQYDASDLICDLLHLLQQSKCDPLQAVRSALSNFRAESLEHATGDEAILDPDAYVLDQLAEPLAAGRAALDDEDGSNDHEHDCLHALVTAIEQLKGA